MRGAGSIFVTHAVLPMHPDVVSSTGIPPIVLLAEDNAESLERYLRCLETAGMWVATAAGPQDALSTAVELRPDLVVTDLEIGARRLIRELKTQPATTAIPVLALSANGNPAEQSPAQTTAEVWLLKPVRPEALLREIRQLLQKSRQLRRKSDAVTARAVALRERSGQLLGRSQELAAALESADRACPACGQMLLWIERGRLGGVDYDYYRWCGQGCGLFAFDRAAAKWLKLA